MDKPALAHWREVIKETVLRAVLAEVPSEVAGTESETASA